MALSYDSISIAGVATDVLTLAGTGDTREFILASVLTASDVAVLDDINTNGVGATLKEKMQAWDLGNGRKAYDVYQYSVEVFAAYDAALRSAYATRLPSSVVASQTLKLEQIQAVIDGAQLDADKVIAIGAILAG
jgi:hypothetical protein